MDFFLESNDRRGHERFECRAMVQYFIKKHSLRYMDCELVDVSRSGMGICIALPEDIEPGMEVSLEITIPGSLEQVTVRGTIQWCQRAARIRAGVRFANLIEPELITRLIAC